MNEKVKKNIIKGGIIALITLLCVAGFGLLLGSVEAHIDALMRGENFIDFAVLLDPKSWLYGLVMVVLAPLLWLATGKHSKKASSILKGAAKGVDGALENSRFMTDKERDINFSHYQWNTAQGNKDGVPMRAVYNEKKKIMEINVAPGMHSLVIGATGSGKTTTFINPMIQVIAETQGGSSMIMTDPKGELFSLHSQKLLEMGYDVKVLDLRDTYSSYRWNPLESVWDSYQEFVEATKGIRAHTDSVDNYELHKENPDKAYEEADRWFEYRGKAYADKQMCIDEVSVTKQKIFDGMYEDLNDLVSVICPIESPDDPVWEKGARSIVMSTLIAMLEDSEDPELGMTKEKFNFFNLNKIIANSEDNFKALKDYFSGRSPLSTAVTLSRQVLSAADNTLSSYMSIAFDKLSMFNDQGLCALTSATDIQADGFADRPTALFMKIPDEKDTRHALASVFILCIYKALIKKASTREDLSLPRNVYFILDEFGNMPKIEKFDKMITVGRSRKIWFNMVVQSYAQLSNVYSENVANIVKSNCGVKMFIGSNDIETCKEFSELCGNMTVSTSSVSSSTGDKSGELSYSTQIQTRPLIYPSELQKLNNRESTGNAIIVTFGNYPLKTKFTPSYRCPLYKFGQMDLTEVRRNSFYPERVFYNIALRNSHVLGEKAI